MESNEDLVKTKLTTTTDEGHNSKEVISKDQITIPAQPEWRYAKYFPGAYSPRRQLPFKGRKMHIAISLIAGLAIMFYGYDQGVMSGVNNSPDYQSLMGVLHDVQTDRDSATIGGIVAIYYVGTLIGALMGGILGDSIGRLRTILFGCFFATIGAALQTSAQNFGWMCWARVITGIGTGHLNAIVPVWVSEISHHNARGAALGFEFFLNIGGLVVAYWLEFGLREANPSLRWRLPLGVQLLFLLALMVLVPLFPESPRWLAKMGKNEDAKHVLKVLRYQEGEDLIQFEGRVDEELCGILDTVQIERKKDLQGATGYWSMLFKNDPQHIRRRTWLVIWLQIMQELIGIGVVTVYAPTVFRQAGYSQYKSELLAGINNLSYMMSVLVAVVTLDRVGRRITLYWGAIVMGICLLVCGIAARYATDAEISDETRQNWGAVVTTFIFLYTATFGATWLTVPWLVPTEIMPLFVRAKGGCWSVVGWSIGNALVTEIAPYLFNAITYWTFILFGLLNFFTLPNIYLLYPETAGRGLEDMDVLFESESPFIHHQKSKKASKITTQ
ncbi:general substrate transporter [Phakopsora pachyrhizi]|nr:general substrate transporter [Phakopsora pachyrhizi]